MTSDRDSELNIVSLTWLKLS